MDFFKSLLEGILKLAAIAAAFFWAGRKSSEAKNAQQTADALQREAQIIIDGPHTDYDFHQWMQRRMQDKPPSDYDQSHG